VSEEFEQSEESIDKSDEKYKLILENANDLITIVNENFKREYINEKAYFNITGYIKKDVIGKSLLAFLHPDDKKLARKALREGLKEGIVKKEFRVMHKDGFYIWLEFKGRTFIDTDGVKKAIIISRDITERKKADQKMLESEKKFRNLVNNLTDIILEIKLNGIVTYVSPQCYNIMGYQPTELLGKNSLNYIYPEDVLTIADAMKNALQTKEMILVRRYRLLHKCGDIVYASARGKYVKVNGTDRFIVTIRDITAQIRVEQKLRESEEKYRLISENANELIFIVSDNLNIDYVNKKPLYNLSGYSIEDVIGKRALNFIHLDDAEGAFKEFYETFNKEGRGSVEARVKHKDGHYIYVEITGSLFHNEKGEPKALLIVRDITERKEAENSMLEEYKKLEELSQIKSDLIMQASHELKTPLSSIYAASQILQNTNINQFDEKSVEFIEMIYRGSQRLRQLIDNLLDVSRIESGKLNLSLKKENVVDLIHSCYSDLKYLADKKNINIKFEFPEEFILNIDRIRMEQVFTNLLSNAIKFTPPKGNIYVTLNFEKEWTDIIIRDTGIGLTKKEKESLFQKFGKIIRVRKDNNVDLEGSGLGLYISKEILELHQGNILVESDGRGKGSTFRIRLPKSL
jgi:PAS domain S-box-containing protein